MFFDRKSIDAEINFEQYQRQKPNDENLELEYDVGNNNFLEFVKTIILSTHSSFFYEPSENECK